MGISQKDNWQMKLGYLRPKSAGSDYDDKGGRNSKGDDPISGTDSRGESKRGSRDVTPENDRGQSDRVHSPHLKGKRGHCEGSLTWRFGAYLRKQRRGERSNSAKQER